MNIYKLRNANNFQQPKVHCSTIYNSQDVETTVETISRGVDKEDVVHIYIGILATKRNGTESFVVMWMNLESVIQNE